MDAELQKIIERYGGLAIILILLAAGWFAMRLHRGQRLITEKATKKTTAALCQAERACAEYARTRQACAVAGAMTRCVEIQLGTAEKVRTATPLAKQTGP
jgi:hypothetical protein